MFVKLLTFFVCKLLSFMFPDSDPNLHRIYFNVRNTWLVIFKKVVRDSGNIHFGVKYCRQLLAPQFTLHNSGCTNYQCCGVGAVLFCRSREKRGSSGSSSELWYKEISNQHLSICPFQWSTGRAKENTRTYLFVNKTSPEKLRSKILQHFFTVGLRSWIWIWSRSRKLD